MLELGNSTPPADDLIQDVSEANFMEAVVDASQTTPIIVDFLGPVVRALQNAWPCA